MEDVKLGERTNELRDGMRIDWDVPIATDDGLVLRADIYRPVEDGRYPVIMSYGPYGKGLLFEDLYADQWRRMAAAHPDVTAGSTNKYQNWEVVDPEKWVPDGYAVIRVDSRGAARSPGLLVIWSAREAKDFYDCIEWAAEQSWSNGKIGLNGISYYAMNQWQVAALQPPHLTAMCIWEGAADFYRDLSHHGGILCTFGRTWFPSQVITVQHGQGTRGLRSSMNGDWVSGPITLTEEELGANRRDFYDDCYNNPLDSADYWQSRMPDWSKITVPLFSASNWGGQGLHTRGNFEGFVRAAS
ncbi:MAG: CocE/NonD family hydrolase, partial [Gammaproteobacteria bacterium]